MAPFFYIYYYGYGDWGLMLLRIVLGLILLRHGWPKLKDIKTTSANFGAMGFRPGGFWGPLTAVVEFFGGLALVFGIWTPIVAALFVVQFAVITVWKLARRQPFVGGYEFDVLILAVSVFLFAQAIDAFFVAQEILLRHQVV